MHLGILYAVQYEIGSFCLASNPGEGHDVFSPTRLASPFPDCVSFDEDSVFQAELGIVQLGVNKAIPKNQ
jgi:hypothetical protein